MIRGVEPGRLCHHSMSVMKRLVRITVFLSAAGLLQAQEPAAIPLLEITGDGQSAPAEKPGNASPKMNKEVHLADKPDAAPGPFDIEPPADSPDPEKTGELTSPLPGDEEQPPRPPVTGTVEVTAKDNGQIVPAQVGNLIRITLESHPSAGYNWELRGFDFGVAVFHTSELAARAEGNVLFGAPGDTIITLQAVKPGTQNIELVYRRPWEPPDQVEARFVFQLEVAGSPDASPVPTPAPES